MRRLGSLLVRPASSAGSRTGGGSGRRPGLRVLALVGVALAVLVGTPWAASAHDVLERSDPADGSVLYRLPAAVTLTFAEEPLAVGTQVVVTGPSGPVAEGAPTIAGTAVRQRLAADAPAGDYTVTYRVTSDDGHPVSGTLTFHARVGLDGSTATAAPSVDVRAAATDDGGSTLVPVLLTVVGTTVLLGVGGFLVLRSRPSERS